MFPRHSIWATRRVHVRLFLQLLLLTPYAFVLLDTVVQLPRPSSILSGDLQ